MKKRIMGNRQKNIFQSIDYFGKCVGDSSLLGRLGGAEVKACGATHATNLLELAFATSVKENFVFPIISSSSNRMGVTSSAENEPTSTSTVLSQYELTAYPNPFNENTIIKTILPKNSTTTYLVIRDVAGKEILRKQLKEKITHYTIDNAFIQPGIYIYYIEEEGVIKLTQKLIKTQ